MVFIYDLKIQYTHFLYKIFLLISSDISKKVGKKMKIGHLSFPAQKVIGYSI